MGRVAESAGHGENEPINGFLFPDIVRYVHVPDFQFHFQPRIQPSAGTGEFDGMALALMALCLGYGKRRKRDEESW